MKAQLILVLSLSSAAALGSPAAEEVSAPQGSAAPSGASSLEKRAPSLDEAVETGRRDLFAARSDEIEARAKLYALVMDDPAAVEAARRVEELRQRRLAAEEELRLARQRLLDSEREALRTGRDEGNRSTARPWVYGLGVVVIGLVFVGAFRSRRLLRRRLRGFQQDDVVEYEGDRAWVDEIRGNSLVLRKLSGEFDTLSPERLVAVKKLEEGEEVVSVSTRVSYRADLDQAIEVVGSVVDRFIERSDLGSYVSGTDRISVDRFERDAAWLRVTVTASAVAREAIEIQLRAALEAEIAATGLS